MITESMVLPGSARVVIADDSPTVRTALTNWVARLPGVEIVGIAQTGLEALEMIRDLRPDLVTLDIRMPRMNGVAVLESLRREGLETPVIVLTGVEETEYRDRCLALGARCFLNKQREFEVAVDLIREEGRRHVVAPV